MSGYALSDLDRRVANMIRIGAVSAVDLDNKLAKVAIVDDAGVGITTDWIPWARAKAGKDRDWHAPDVGEQVIVFSPGGEFDQGVIWGSINQDSFPANGNEQTATRTTFDDGSIVEYDRASHALNLTLNSNAALTITIGGMTVQVTKDLASLGAGALDFVALAQKVDDILSAVYSCLISNCGPPGSPLVGASTLLLAYPTAFPSVAATKVKAA